MTLFGLFLLMLFSSAASAHTGHAMLSGFYEGFIHPIAGWDHLLMMLAVGLMAAQSERHMRWFLPATFMVMMTAGGVLSLTNNLLSGLELLIAATLVMMGCALMMTDSISNRLKLLLVGVLALPHGWAHGMEIGANALSPLLGLLIATMLLHIVGAYCWQVQPLIKLSINRLAGGLMLMAGSFFVLT